MWRQNLFSKRSAIPQGALDEFHILTRKEKTDFDFVELILTRNGRTEQGHVAFIQDCGDQFYVGTAGKVSDVLGEAFPFAHEELRTSDGKKQGREITFVHGYFAPKRVRIPDLNELLEQQLKHLQEILQRANAPAWESPVAIQDAFFTCPRKQDTDWDRIATDFERKRYPMQGMTFTIDGKAFYPLEPIEERTVKSAKNSISSPRKKSRWKTKISEWFPSILPRRHSSHDENE